MAAIWCAERETWRSWSFSSSGKVYVQDPSARFAAMAAGAKPGMRVLDCCAAPGGKSFAAAIAMQNEGSVTSCDIHAHKVSLIEKGAARLGVSIDPCAAGGCVAV